jgi:hypothetical protein
MGSKGVSSMVERKTLDYPDEVLLKRQAGALAYKYLKEAIEAFEAKKGYTPPNLKFWSYSIVKETGPVEKAEPDLEEFMDVVPETRERLLVVLTYKEVTEHDDPYYIELEIDLGKELKG